MSIPISQFIPPHPLLSGNHKFTLYIKAPVKEAFADYRVRKDLSLPWALWCCWLPPAPLWSLTTLSCVLGVSSQTENQLWPSTATSLRPPSEQTEHLCLQRRHSITQEGFPWWRSSSRSLTDYVQALESNHHTLYSTTSLWDKYYWIHFTDEETEAHAGELVVCPKLWGSEGQELRQTVRSKGKRDGRWWMGQTEAEGQTGGRTPPCGIPAMSSSQMAPSLWAPCHIRGI